MNYLETNNLWVITTRQERIRGLTWNMRVCDLIIFTSILELFREYHIGLYLGHWNSTVNQCDTPYRGAIPSESSICFINKRYFMTNLRLEKPSYTASHWIDWDRYQCNTHEFPEMDNTARNRAMNRSQSDHRGAT